MALTAAERREVAAALARVRVGMVTTRRADGSLHTRPMGHHGFDRDEGALWFFTRADDAKVAELERDPQVSVGFADPRSRRYVAVSGTGSLLRDTERARALWRWSEREWFPAGPEDPQLLLLRVEVSTAEVWQPPPKAVGRLAGWLSARLRGRPASLGDHRRWGS